MIASLTRMLSRRLPLTGLALAAAALTAPGVAQAELVYIVEAVADNYVQRDGTTKDGSAETFLVKKAAGATASTNRKGYMRFDLNGLNVDTSVAAEYRAYLESYSGGGTGFTTRLYGLNSGFAPGIGVQGADWNEGTINYNNAPANATSGHNFTGDATFIGDDFTGPGADTVIPIASLGGFIQPNGTVTLMASGGIDERFGTFASRESTTNDGPRLIVTSLDPVALNSTDSILGERQSNAPAAGYYADGNTGGTVGVSGSTASSTRENNNLVIGFTLPEIKGNIVSATLSLDKLGERFDSGNPFDLDLYGLLTANPDGSGTGFFFEGDADPNANVIELADDFITDTQGNGSTSFADVTAFIQALYNLGMPSQGEVFFRLNPDRNLSLASIDRLIVDLSSANLQIVAVVVPTPAALPAGLALIGLVAVKRRRRSTGLTTSRRV